MALLALVSGRKGPRADDREALHDRGVAVLAGAALLIFGEGHR